MAVATLISWLCTAGIGACMLRAWIARGGPRLRRAPGDRLPPVIVYGHVSLATIGLVLWVCYVLTGLIAVAWAAAGLLMPVVGLGVAMVTIWTPYPLPGAPGTPGPLAGGMFAAPAEDALASRLTDDVLTRALTDDALARALADEVLAGVTPEPPAAGMTRSYLTPLIPAGHGAAALTTVLLAILTAASHR